MREGIFGIKECNETIAVALSFEDACEAMEQFKQKENKPKYKGLRIMKAMPGQEQFDMVYYSGVEKA